MAQNTILEFLYTSHLYKVPMYKSFYEQVVCKQGSTRVYKNAIQASEALQPYFKESEGILGSAAAFLQDLQPKIFFPMSRLTQEKRKILCCQATYKNSKKIRHQVFCPTICTICSIQGKQRIYIQQATYKGNIPCVLNQEFLFLVHKYWDSEATRLG
jgi:hypothetical protein